MRHENNFLVRIVLILILLAIIALEFPAERKQSQLYSKFKKEKDLIARIPEMEQMVRVNFLTPESAVKVVYDLQGTSIKNGVPYALIDGNIFKQGDRIGPFEITEITARIVRFQNPLTQEVKELTLPALPVQ